MSGERTRDELLNDLAAMTRARDRLEDGYGKALVQVDRLRAENEKLEGIANDLQGDALTLRAERDEARALLREVIEVYVATGHIGFMRMARIAALLDGEA